MLPPYKHKMAQSSFSNDCADVFAGGFRMTRGGVARIRGAIAEYSALSEVTIPAHNADKLQGMPYEELVYVTQFKVETRRNSRQIGKHC